MNYETLEPNKYYLVYPDGRRVIFMGMENAYIVKTSAGDIKVSEADLLKVEEIKDDVTPIKNHVSEVSSVMHFLAWTPKFIKAIILIITLVTTVYGLKSLFDDFNKTKETIELKK